MIRPSGDFNLDYNCYKKQKTGEDDRCLQENAPILQSAPILMEIFCYVIDSSNTSIGRSLHDCELVSKQFYEMCQLVKMVYFNTLGISSSILKEKNAIKFIQSYKPSDLSHLGLTLIQGPSGYELTVKGDLKIDLQYFSNLTSLSCSLSTLISVDSPLDLTQLKSLELSNIEGDFPNLQNCEILNTLTISGKKLKDSKRNFAHVPFTNLLELSISQVGFNANLEGIDFPNLKTLTFHEGTGPFGKSSAPIDFSRFPKFEYGSFEAKVNREVDRHQMTEAFRAIETAKYFDFHMAYHRTRRVCLHLKGRLERL